MAKRRSAEELHQIYLMSAELLHEDGEAAVISYLEDQHYMTPKATWLNILRSRDWKTAEAEYKHGKRAEKVTEKEADEPAKQEEQVVLGGVVYTKADMQEELLEKKMMEAEAAQDRIMDKMEEEKKALAEKKYAEEPKKKKDWKPRGIRTEWEVRQDRLKEILQGMTRYSVARFAIPIEWLCELADMFCIKIDVIQAEKDNQESAEE